MIEEQGYGDKIKIDNWKYTDKDSSYSERAELLVKNAKKHLRETGDDKYYLNNFNGLESLLGAGASVVGLNRPQHGGGYAHEIVYEGYTFITVTSEPIKF